MKKGGDYYDLNYELIYNSVIVIESLGEDESKTGKELFDQVISVRCKERELLPYYKLVENKDEFFRALGDIKDAVLNKGHFPFLHFEMHGGDEGFRLASGERVLYTELTDFCREINVFLKNKLLISIAACKGAAMYKMIDINKPTPFFGIIGPKKDMYNVDLLSDFGSFYDVLLLEHDLEAAIDALNRFQGFVDYAFIPAEMLWDRLSEHLKNNKRSSKKIFNDLKSRTIDIFPTLNRSQRRAKLRQNISEHDQDAHREQVRRIFLMQSN